jgi:beta-lactamase class D
MGERSGCRARRATDVSRRRAGRCGGARLIWALGSAVLLVAACSRGGEQGQLWQEGELAPFFGVYDGCMVLLDTGREETARYHPERCAERLPPCSTFKIPNSMIGLETGVIADQDHVIAWDGTQYPVESWNRDHTLASAIAHSVVWYYEALADRVGPERMAQYLADLGYGNQDISGWDDPFWLGSSLTISADEQVVFLRRWLEGELPVSARTVEIVAQITTLSQEGGAVYRGKTGSCLVGTEPVGWFVGAISREEGGMIFALNITGDGADGRQARVIAEEILRYVEVLGDDG